MKKHASSLKIRVKKLRSHRHFNKAAIFALGFAIVGVITALAILAATPTAYFEAESGSRTANVQLVSDGTASGGQAIRFNVSTQPSGGFRVVGSDIIDPDGNKFIPLGANVGARIKFDCYAYTSDCASATGHVNDAIAWGWNMIRLNVPTTPGVGVTFEDTMTGVEALIDEYTAREIVVMPDAHDVTGSNLPLTDPKYTNINMFWDRILAKYKDNPYVWINYVNEPVTSGQTLLWSTLGNSHYNRVRAQTSNLFVIDLTNWGQEANLFGASGDNTGTNFLAGKTNVVFSWHNYGAAGTEAQMTQYANSMKAKGLAVMIGEIGEHWDPNFHQDLLYPGSDANERRGVKWTFDNFWSIGFGGLYWHGTGAGDNFTLHSNPNTGRGHLWYSTTPLSPAGSRLRAQPSLKPSN